MRVKKLWVWALCAAIYNVVIDLAKDLVLRKNETWKMTSCNGHGIVCNPREEETRPFTDPMTVGLSELK